MTSHAYCSENSEFFSIFGSQAVPIKSIVPIIPREHGAPPCYVVLVEQLPLTIANQLAEMIYEEWQPECESLQMAKEYILQGLPLRITHFSGVGTDDYYQMPMGAALNIAIRSAYEHQN